MPSTGDATLKGAVDRRRGPRGGDGEDRPGKRRARPVPFRGRFVDHPAGDVAHPPPGRRRSRPSTARCPRGGFRGGLHAEISPPGQALGQLRGQGGPAGRARRARPCRGRPRSRARSTFGFDATADVAPSGRPEVVDRLRPRRGREHPLSRHDPRSRVGDSSRLKDGRGDPARLSAASLGGRPLKASRVDVAAPYAFTRGWTWPTGTSTRSSRSSPRSPVPRRSGGAITVKTEAHGTLPPRDLSITRRRHPQARSAPGRSCWGTCRFGGGPRAT